MDAYTPYRVAAAELSWTPVSLRYWVRRYNTRNTSQPIRRIHGRVHRDDLQRALEKEAERYTHGREME